MDLTTFEIVKALIVRLKKENIYYFSKRELEIHLNYFSKSEKYSSLFSDDVDINDTISILLKCGYLYAFSTDQDTIYIIKSENFVNYNELLEEVLESYCNIRKICDNYDNLKCELIDSNNTYMIVEGKIGNNDVKWTLNTDGIIKNRNIRLAKGLKHTYKNPFNNKTSLFEEANFDIVDVCNSTYVLRQQIINNEVSDSILYTDSDEKEEIENIAKKFCKK